MIHGQPCPPTTARPRVYALARILVALCLLGTSPALAAGRRFSNKAFRIADFEVPRGWSIAPPSPYPGVLLVAISTSEQSSTAGRARTDEARLLLAAQRITPGEDASTLAADARAQLVRQGYGDVRITPLGAGHGGEDRARLDGTNPRAHRQLRQLYLVDGDLLIVLTVVTPAARQVRVLSEFDDAADKLVLARPESPATPLPSVEKDGAAPPSKDAPPTKETPPRDPEGEPTTDGGSVARPDRTRPRTPAP